MADGRITIDTKIDTNGITTGTDKIMASLGRMAKEAGRLKQTVADSFSAQAGSVMKSVKANKEQRKAIDEVNQAQEELSGQQAPTEEYKRLLSAMGEVEQSIKKITDQQQEWLDIGFPVDSEAFATSDAKLEKLYSTMKKLKIQQEEMIANSTAFIGANSSEAPVTLPASANEADGMVKIFERLKAKAAEYGTALNSSSGNVNSFKATMGGLAIVLTRTIPILGKFAGMMGKGIFTGMISGLKNLSKAAEKASIKLAQLVGRGIVGGLKKITAGIFGLNKATNKSTAGFGSSLKTLIKYGLGIRGLYALIGKLRSALQEGFRNLAQYSSNTNAAISGLMSSLTQCKNALATAFDPILQAVAPALNYMISLVTAAATAVAQLIAILTGKGTFIKATKVQQDYAKSLEGTGSAAKGAGEDAEGALAPFDKLNVMAEEAASGGSGGGGGGSALSPSDMFETVKVGDSFKEFADLFKKHDWKGIGEYVAGQINQGLQKIYDVINWNNVGPKITYFVNAFSDTFNSLVDKLDWDLLGRVIGAGVNDVVNTLNLLYDKIDWENLGKKLAEGANGLVDEINWNEIGRLLVQKFNAAVKTLYGFVTEFDWEKFGKSIGESLNGAISSIDPKLWADALSGLVKGIFDAIIEFLNETDWQEIGNKIADFIGGIDYAGISDKLFEGIGAALASLAEFIWGLVEAAWDKVVTWWKENAYEDGKFTMQGLLDGILEGLKNIATWIREHIFNPIIKGFKNAFGIHSPSTVMKEMGGYLIDGLKQGISDFIPSLMDKFSEIKQKISNVWEEVRRSTSEKWEGIKGIVSDAISFIERLIDSAMDAINNLLGKTEKLEKNTNGPIGQLTSGPHKLTGRSISTMSFVPTSEPIHLPRLASGTVVPPRAGEFAAILGDNQRETEIVSPLSTMKQALKEGLEEFGGIGGGDIIAYIYLDGKELGRSMVKFTREEKTRTGRNPLLV